MLSAVHKFGAIALVATACSTSVLAQDGDFYPMICKAGGGDRGPIIEPQDKSATIWLSFRHGTKGYSSDPEALEPGQCTWDDRGMRADEPTVAAIKISNGGETKFNANVIFFPLVRARQTIANPMVFQMLRPRGGGMTINILEPQQSGDRAYERKGTIDLTEGKLFTLYVRSVSGEPRRGLVSRTAGNGQQDYMEVQRMLPSGPAISTTSVRRTNPQEGVITRVPINPNPQEGVITRVPINPNPQEGVITRVPINRN